MPAIALVVLLSICGCEQPTAKVTPVAASRPAGPVGNVKGVALFTGTPPLPVMVMGKTCHAGGHDTTVRPVMVGANHELMQAVVFLKAAGGDAVGPPDPPVVLDQIDCQYSPSVVALHTGQVLRVISEDATIHNVHFLAIDNPSSNTGMNGAGQKMDVIFKLPESFEVKCDVHPWMSASINVFDHPHFAVTDRDGKFEIRDVPVGKQKLVFRHAYLGEMEVDVTVEEGKTAEVTGTFEKGAKE